jgi:hypothetical protein
VGIIPYDLGLMLNFFDVIRNKMVTIIFIDSGWHLMVTGQSVVMYSRLHLLATDTKVIKYVLAMIIANWFISNVPTTVFVFGASSSNPRPYNKPYAVWERLQLCMYFVQESIIAGIYIYYVVKLLQVGENQAQNGRSRSVMESAVVWSRHSKKVLKHLIYVNIGIILLDITLLTMEFIGHYELQVLYKVLILSLIATPQN